MYVDGAGIGAILVGFVFGVVFTLAVQSYLLWRLFHISARKVTSDYAPINVPNPFAADSSQESRRGRLTTPTTSSSFQLPRELSKLLRAHIDGRSGTTACSSAISNTEPTNSCLFLNLICQFLFKELRDTVRVRRWFMHKLSVELEELLQRTTVGKLLEKITVRDLQLGHQFPVFKSVSVFDVRLHEAGHIEELDVLIDLDYEGGFHLAVDADLVLQRSAFLAVRVVQLKGRARLRFSRTPYTHWSFAFCDEPHLDVQVESHFQGRPLPHVTSLIVNQIRRLVRKKHTLPNYKVRYRPFFEKPECGVDDVDVYLLAKNRITEGLLDVTVVECSRLFGGDDAICCDARVYCTLAIDCAVWGEYVPSYSTTWIPRDLNVVRQQGQTVGVTFRQEFVLDKYEHCVIVEAVTANSPASIAGVRSGDILVTVNGTKVNSVSQAAKLCKANHDVSQTASKFTFRIERISNCARGNSLFSREDGDETNLSSAEGGVAQIVPRMLVDTHEAAGVTEKKQSPRRTHSPIESAYKEKVVADGCDDGKNHSKRSSSHLELTDTVQLEGPNGSVTLRRTSAFKFVRDPIFHETFSFEVENRHRFLNLSVWRCREDQKDRLSSPSTTASAVSSTGACGGGGPGAGATCYSTRVADKADVLLGHVSVSLLDVAIECATNSRGVHRRTFQLLPPEPKAVAHSRNSKLASHPGFDKTLCYGDVTLSFIHKPQKMAAEKTNINRHSSRDENAACIVPTVTRTESDGEDDNNFSILNNDSPAPNELERLSHDFIITQFNSTTSCHFCGKKVWFKIAFKCRLCALVCHKKCVVKCRDATTCCRDGVRLKRQGDVGLKIAKTDSSLGDSGLDGIYGDDTADRTSLLESPKTQRRLRSLLSVVSASHSDCVSTPRHAAGELPQESLVCADSTQSLAPPGCAAHSSPAVSRSLPPSPQTSPASSRKASLQGNLFEVGESGDSDADDIGITVERLLQYTNDETVVSVAKEKGRELFANEALEERKSKLDSMVSRLQVEIYQEAERRNLLAKSESELIGGGPRSRRERTRLSLLLAKSDEKIQALSILMLFYCSGLQHCHELEDTLTRQKLSEASAEPPPPPIYDELVSPATVSAEMDAAVVGTTNSDDDDDDFEGQC